MNAGAPPQLLADFQRAEARLPKIDEAAARRLPERARRIFAAIAALDRGDRKGVLETAAAIRAADGHAHEDGDVAAILELMAGPAPAQGSARRSPGPIPGLHEALASWRQGKKPRGSAALRQRARARPALSGLVDLLGRRRTLHLATTSLDELSPRLRPLMILAHALSDDPHAAPPANLREVVGDGDPVGIDRYLDAASMGEQAAMIREWADNPRIDWTRRHAFAAASAAMIRRENAQSVMADLLRGIHARLAAGRASDAHAGVAVAGVLAAQAHLGDDLVRHLAVVRRRLDGLRTPRSGLPTLLTLWRRCLGRPPAERLVIARAIVDALRSMLAHGEPRPPEVSFAIEPVVYLFTTTDDEAERVRVIEGIGVLLPPAKVAEVMARAEPTARRRMEGLHALSQGRVRGALDAMVKLARAGAAGDATELLERALDWLYFDPDTPELRAFERAIAALGADPSARLEPRALPWLLLAADDLEIPRAPIESLVRRQLAAPIADGAPTIAEAILASALLGDEAGVQERVRGLGRWLRRGAASPEVADDVALATLARVYRELDRLAAPETWIRALTPLTAFVLRDGPERALRAAQRAGAASEAKAPGYGAWAREHQDRLGEDPYWDALIELAGAFEDEGEEDDDDNPYDFGFDLDGDPHDIPF